MEKEIAKKINARIAEKHRASVDAGLATRAIGWLVCPSCAGDLRVVSGFLSVFTGVEKLKCTDCGMNFKRRTDQ